MNRQLLTRSCYVDFDGPASGSSPNSSSSLPSACPSRRGDRRGCGVGVQVADSSDKDGRDAAVGRAKKRLAAIAGMVAFAVVLVSTAAVSRGGSNFYSSWPLFAGKKTSVELYSVVASAARASAGTLASSSVASAAAAASVENSTALIVIALLNRFYFGGRYARPVPGCTKSNGESLSCEFTADKERFHDAEALA